MKKKSGKSGAAKSVKNLSAKTLSPKTAKGVRGGQGIEISDYGFGVSMPVSTSRSSVKK